MPFEPRLLAAAAGVHERLPCLLGVLMLLKGQQFLYRVHHPIQEEKVVTLHH